MFTNNVVVQKTINNVNYLQFKKLLELGVNHCFVMKELNFTFKHQTLEDCYSSFKHVAEDFNFNLNNLCRPVQKHSANVKIVDNKKGINLPEYENTDALITNIKDTPLAITTADCIPIIVYDPVKKVIANVHSGWKGTYQEIILNTITEMKVVFNSKEEDLLFFFGPAICQECFEVDEDVKDMFMKKFAYLDNIKDIIKTGSIKDNKQKYNINTILLNKTLLINKNISKENMYFANICTCCNKDYMHSYRARKDNTFGLGVTIVSL